MRHRYLPSLILAVAALAGMVLFGGTAPATAQETETVELFPVCNNVAVTWPSGTPTSTVAANIQPAAALQSIWRFNNLQQRFEGFSPQFPEVSDLRTVNLIDPVFVCMSAPGTMTRPRI